MGWLVGIRGALAANVFLGASSQSSREQNFSAKCEIYLSMLSHMLQKETLELCQLILSKSVQRDLYSDICG